MKNGNQPAAARPTAEALTVAQLNAVDLLAAGKNDTDTAAALDLNRVTVTRWRLYDVDFRAALGERRAAIWGAAGDRLRALLPKALDALADVLDNGADRVTVALAVLKLAGPLPLVPTDPTDPDEYVRQQVEQERDRAEVETPALDSMRGLPDRATHERMVRRRLVRLAAGPKHEDAPTLNGTGRPT